MNEQKAYWTHEISKVLSVSDSTLRKWCLELEKQGYKFTKGENNSRAYLVRDRELLINIKHYMRTGNLTIENAVGQALGELKFITTNDRRSSDLEVVRGSFEHEFKNINNRLDKQEEFNKKILERMEERDRNLMIVLNEIQEHKKEIAATNKSKAWWQFWK